MSEDTFPRTQTESAAAEPLSGQTTSRSGRWPNLRGLQAKLIIPYVLLTLAIAMIGIYVVTRLVTSSLRERIANQLIEASQVASDGVVRKERAQLDNLRSLVFTEGVPQAMAKQDLPELQTRLLPLVVNFKVEAVTAINLQGQAFLTLVRDPATGQYATSAGGDFAQYPLVAKILQGQQDPLGDKFIALLPTEQGRYLFTSAPVLDLSGKLVGVLMVGTRLDTFLGDLKAQTGADVVLLDESGKFVTSTLADSEKANIKRTLELSPQEAAGLDLSLPKDLILYDRSYQARYARLIVRQQPLGVLGVVLPGTYVVERGTTSRNQILVLFAIGTIGVILLGYALAQGIARPILRLRAVSQAVASGDLKQRTGLRQPDEIGELASAFDVMTDRLRERTEEIMQRTEQLAEANARLQSAQQQLVQSEKLAAVGQLTAGIVHDVKNPLAIIVGLAEELPEHSDLNPVARKYLTTIRDSARRANTIVTDLLKFARESTPELKLQDLRDTVETVLRLTDYMARKAKVTVTKDLPGAAMMVSYDAVQIEQVLMNLVQNAIQAMPHGGALHVSLRQSDDVVAVVVKDTGIGIPPQNLNRIFDPFFTTKPPGEGTGLGLSTSYGIVARHGGRIDVASQVGEGTVFTIWLAARPVKPKGNGEMKS
jgi:two-component system, NtrC family, sensor kinase